MKNLLQNIYKPRHYFQDLMEIKKSGLQLGLYFALILGYKPLLDDWIHKDRLEEFRKACRKYGFHVREDVVFRNIAKKDIPHSVLGRERVTTTSAYGLPLSTKTDEEVHVFLAKDRSALKKAMWYPVIIKDRVLFSPRIDHLKYGYVLGYPDCCIRFFRTYNNWLDRSYLFEAYRNTKSAASFLCNPFLKDTGFTYIYHMPCAYDCAETIRRTGQLRKEILKREPLFVQKTDRYLKMPFLVFYERKFYTFEGNFNAQGFLSYRKAHFVSPDRSKDAYGRDLDEANGLKLEGRTIHLYRKKKFFKSFSVPLKSFAPEYPFLMQFQ